MSDSTDIFSYAAEADAERARASRAEARIMILASENLSISSKLSTAMKRLSHAESLVESMHDTAASTAVENSARIFSLLAENESLSNHLTSLRGTLERFESEKIEMQGAIHVRNQSLASTNSRADANDIEREELRALTGDLAEELDTMRLRIVTLETAVTRSREREANLMVTLTEADTALLQARTVGVEAMLASDIARNSERVAVREAREAIAAIAIERAELASSTLIANTAAATASSHTADLASRAALDLILTSSSTISNRAATTPATPLIQQRGGDSQSLLSSRLEESRSANLTIKLELESVRGAHSSVMRRAEIAEEEIFHFKREAAMATACAEENKVKALRAIAALASADSRTEDVNRAFIAATQRADALVLSIDIARRAVSTAEAERDAAMFAASKQATAREEALYRAAAAESAASSALEEAREARRTVSRARASAVITTAMVESDALSQSQLQASAVKNENTLSPASGLRQDLARLHAVLTSTQASLNASWVHG